MALDAHADRLERISVGYAAREGFTRDDDWFLLKLVVGPRARRGPAAARSGVVGRAWGELGELTQVVLARTGRGKDRGWDPAEVDRRLAQECADLLGHVLLLARRHGVDLDAAVDEKWLQWERLV